jgi:hypothetical protein
MTDQLPTTDHFAILDDKDIVINIILASSAEDAAASAGVDFSKVIPAPEIHEPKPEDSFNSPVTPQIGAPYLRSKGRFVGHQPWPSWVLNADGNWESPIPMPSDPLPEGFVYVWDEGITGENAVTTGVNGWKIFDPSVNNPTHAQFGMNIQPSGDRPSEDYIWIDEIGQWVDTKNDIRFNSGRAQD